MKYLLKYNIIHIVVLLLFNFIGLYGIPILFHDHLISFIMAPIYFSMVNLFIIYWVLKFGLPVNYSLFDKAKLPSSFSDYFFILVVILGSFIGSHLISILLQYHLFDLLTTNVQKPIVLPTINSAIDVRFAITFLLILSTIILVVSEEMFFRVYLFEKQFIYSKNFTFLLNALFFTIYHLFKNANLVEFFPVALMYSLVYQHKRNVIITFIPHIMINSIYISRFIFPLY